ncbi:MAG: hypothetical protein WD738_02330 [Pirellulales bacterium]
MSFRYASYEVDPSPTVPSGVPYRPEVTIDVIGRRRIETIQALVDTGSDETVFPASLANAIGVQIDYASAGQASAVGGHTVQLVPGSVVLQITEGERKYRWQTVVGFLEVEQPEDEVALLGYAGFLEFFRATFDSQSHELELTPNDSFPHASY